MTKRDVRGWWSGTAAAAMLVMFGVATVMAQAQAADGTLATVRLTRAVTADGQPLPAGTYAVRLSDAAVTPVSGQAPDAERWVEFVQSGTVKGRELATVLVGAAVKQVAKEAPPASGRSRVELLNGSKYLRVWINHGGTNYLVNLAVAVAAK